MKTEESNLSPYGKTSPLSLPNLSSPNGFTISILLVEQGVKFFTEMQGTYCPAWYEPSTAISNSKMEWGFPR